ncbi:MAG: hypothetical protein V1887_04705 [Candidatus Aenigmatarchaeota archaeon]
MQILENRFHPETGEMLMHTGGRQDGLPVLESRRTGKTYLLGKPEKKLVEKSPPMTGNIIVTEYSRMPVPCQECGSWLGNIIGEITIGVGSDNEENESQKRLLYNCKDGHAVHY